MQWSKKQFSIVAIVAVTSFMGTFLISSVNLALPAIEASFQLDAVALSWVLTSFLLATALFLLPVGRLGDLTGIRRIFKIGVVIFTLSSFLSGLAVSGVWLIVFRFIQGIGAAFTSTTGPAILVSAFLPRQRGRVLGISVSAVYLGLAFGPFVGGMLTQYIGWRSIFFVAAILGLLTSFIAFRFLGKDVALMGVRKRIDLKGTVFYMLGLVALVYGSARIPSASGWVLMAGGALFVLFFWFLENRSEMPVLDTRLYTRNRLSDKIQPRYLATLGMAMCTLGLAAFSWLSAATPLGIIVGMLTWMGLGFAFFSSPNMNTIMSSVQKTQYGLASGSAATMRVLGQIISMTIATLFFAGILGNQTVEAAPDELFLKVIHWGFISFTILSSAGIYFSFNRGKMERGD